MIKVKTMEELTQEQLLVVAKAYQERTFFLEEIVQELDGATEEHLDEEQQEERDEQNDAYRAMIDETNAILQTGVSDSLAERIVEETEWDVNVIRGVVHMTNRWDGKRVPLMNDAAVREFFGWDKGDSDGSKD